MFMVKNFTANEEQAMEELKRRTKDEHTPQILRDQTIFYRFLKARDFNLKNAEIMLRKHFQDRKLYGFDNILERYTPPKSTGLYIPATFLGFDKEGSAIRYIDIGEIDMKGIVNYYEFKELVLYTAYSFASDIEIMTENSLKTGKISYQYFVIFNMDKLNLFNATFRKGVEYMLKGIVLYQNNFPERLKEIHIINASFYFSLLFQILKTVLATELMNKIHIYGYTDWQDVFREKIDEDILPAFLGGKKTDPDGNPRCNTFVIHGKKLPEHLYDKKYKNSIRQENGIQKLTVPRLSSSEIKLPVNSPNTNIEWEFEIEWGDIAFGLCYKEHLDSENLKELIPKQKVKSEKETQKGIYKCDKQGTYIIAFDNTSSWMYSKEIYYKIHVIEPQEK